MNYYDALSSEILLTNLLAFPQCGYVKQPYEEGKGDFIFADFVSDKLYRRIDRERRRAQELEVPYCLDFERHDLLRYGWLAAHQASSPFIRLMYADSQLMMTGFLGYSVKNAYRIDKKNKLALSKSAYQIYHDLYSPDENSSLLQLAIQMRLFICQCCGLVENPDWLDMMGVLFHRTLPIVFRSWPTLMGMVGDLLAQGVGGIRADPEQALQIYKLHNDHYRISKLYGTGALRACAPAHMQLSYLMQAAFGLKKLVNWKKEYPPINRPTRNFRATLELIEFLRNIFSEECPAFKSISDPTTKHTHVMKRWYAWLQVVQNCLNAWDERRNLMKNGLSLGCAYPGSRNYFGGLKLDQFLMELEDKRCNDPSFAAVLNHSPPVDKKRLLNSGIVVQSNGKLPICSGRMIQLYGDPPGSSLYLKCYGYPLYPIDWYAVTERSSAARQSVFNAVRVYTSDTGLWHDLSKNMEIVVQWLEMPTVKGEPGMQ